MVIYFSGTGNSAYTAKVIAKNIQDDIISIGDSIKNNTIEKIESDKPLVFVLPVYAWKIPRVTEKWILEREFSVCKKAYFVITCSGSIGGAPYYAKKLCLQKGLEYMGSSQIIMPNNYIFLAPAPTAEEAKNIIEKSKTDIENTFEIIKNGEILKYNDIKKNGSFANSMFYRFMAKDKKFFATDKCISCGMCVKLCPLNDIELSNGRPKWKGNCTHCMACISYCPQTAIEYGKGTANKQRYKFPQDISI